MGLLVGAKLFDNFHLRIPCYLPHMIIQVLKIPGVAAPKCLLSRLDDLLRPLASLVPSPHQPRLYLPHYGRWSIPSRFAVGARVLRRAQCSFSATTPASPHSVSRRMLRRHARTLFQRCFPSVDQVRRGKMPATFINRPHPMW